MTVAVLAAAAVGAHLLLASSARRRGRRWPWWRTASWTAGVVAVAVALGPVAGAAHADFRAHMLGHLLLGMLGPLLLVLSAPVTLLLRASAPATGRRISGVLRSRVVAVVAHPVVAGVLNVGGLWVLYRTGLFAASMHDPVPHALLHAHVLAAGCLFTYAVAGPDPAPHRPGLPVRAAVLVLAVAAHNVLAKTLYAVPPDGVDPAQAQAGAQIMYYGGAPVEVALMILLGLEWLRVQRRADGRRAVPSTA